MRSLVKPNQWIKNRIKPSCLLAMAMFALVTLTGTETFAEAVDTDSSADGFWLWTFLGRLHPLIVHFPIGLLVVALLMEFIQWRKRSSELQKGINLLLIVGAASAVVAVGFGLFLINTESYGSDALPIHQWTGIATMVLSLATVYFALRNRESAKRILLIATVVGVTVAGHFGASLTHGEDYLSSALPFYDHVEQQDYSAILNVKNGPLTDAQQQELTLQVRTIFAHNCYKCHGQAKTKGELRLDGKAYIMKGGKSGPLFVPGKPTQSELIRRITLPRNHKETMPEKGDALSKQEIDLLELWITQGAPWPDGPEKSVYKVAEMAPRLPSVPAVAGDLQNPIDLFVNTYFEKNQIEWSPVTDDHTYIRRVYLDVLGLLPPPDSIDAFINDNKSNKRSLLVDRLLQRNDDYAQHWLTFWNDALRNDYTGTGYITGGRFDITSWLYTSLQQNKSYNQFVKELINPTKESKGFIAGIQWRGTINASQRTEMQAAQNVSQVLLGLNLKCASCHDSFISDWKLDEAYAFANIFADTTLEINRCDKPTGKFAGRRVLFKELGEINGEAVTSERLKQLADFLVQPKDGRLYRTLVNRVWAQLMGRGIVEPVDVMDNDPWSQDLLDWLASDFASNGYNIKNLITKILTSKTYQQPSIALEESSMLTAHDFVFKGMIRRRMTAEQFTDAVSTAIQPVYPDTLVVKKLLPKEVVNQIPFARASLVKNDPFQTALGRPNRETVSTSRSSQANLLQALELTNGTHFNEAIKRGAILWRKEYPDTKTLIEKLYRKALGREPNADEIEVASSALGQNPTDDQVQDFIWAMTLHPEFQLIF